KIVAALAVLAVSPLQAQDSRLQARLPGEVASQVQQLVDSAAQNGLPTEPLIQKALEGQSKGADGVRIIAAVRTLTGQLGDARTALGPGSPEADIVAGAACLKAGATPAMITELRRLRPEQSVAVPLGVLSDLVALGVEVPKAWDEVHSLAAAHGPDTDFLALRDRVSAPNGKKPPGPAQPKLVPSTNSPP
ncbi:MAG TPA: hypothetical protein VLB12_07605, partial [Gemmatimonadales bacterium]|nr:hypothetical protein [Gemmatimonadales bacterium]